MGYALPPFALAPRERGEGDELGRGFNLFKMFARIFRAIIPAPTRL